MQRTQGIYDDLSRRWDAIPPEIRKKCLRWLKTSPHRDSYYLLQSCVDGETMPPAPPPSPY